MAASNVSARTNETLTNETQAPDQGIAPASVPALLEARDISKSYGRRQVLRGVEFRVAPGSLVGIVGENGAGKSTLLRILAGELRPRSGAVTVRGALGYCPQTVILNDALTVAQHLDYFRAAYRIADTRRAYELVDQLGYRQYASTVVSALSGGTQQKLNLTLALMHDPSVLLLDEPYQGFDWETYLRFWDLCAEMRSRNCAVLIISHLVFDRSRFDAIYRLAEGRLQREQIASAEATVKQ